MTDTIVKRSEIKDRTRNAVAIAGSSGLVTCSKNEMDDQ